MKKIYLFLTLALFAIVNLNSQIPNLNVNAPGFPSGIYTYSGEFNQKPYWVGPSTGSMTNSNAIFSDRFRSNLFSFGDWYGDTNQLRFAFYYSSSTEKYPVSGWPMGWSVTIEGPGVDLESSNLSESSENDGSFKKKIRITHNKFNGETFGGVVGADLVATGALTVDWLPLGLSAMAVLESDSVINFSLDGNAEVHTTDTAILVSLSNAAFANGGEADSTQNSTFTLNLNFINEYIVASVGGDFNSLKNALAIVDDGDIIRLKEGVYTENNLKSAMNLGTLHIIGDGFEKTILQADTIKHTANGRIFDFMSHSRVHLEGITLKNGNHIDGNGMAGCILMQGEGVLEIVNCRILDNRAFSKNSGQTVGGAILCPSIELIGSEVSGNLADNGDKTIFNVYAGAIWTSNGGLISNSTIADNFSAGVGGGLVTSGKKLIIQQSTISGNRTSLLQSGAQTTHSGGIYAQGQVSLVNSIVWGNIAMESADLKTNGSIAVEFNNSFIQEFTIGDTIGKLLSGDPLLDSLRFNCSHIRTFALLDNSPAINNALMIEGISDFDQRGYAILDKRDIGAHENNNTVTFDIGIDTLCTEDSLQITLRAYPNFGVFEGVGVEGRSFNAKSITESGFVAISYKLTAPGCGNLEVSDSIYFEVCKPNNIQNPSLEAHLFPNPVEDELHIINHASATMYISVADLSGKTMIHTISNTPESILNVRDLPVGMYVIKMDSNGYSTVKKFIKH